jgi:hypothetical protein
MSEHRQILGGGEARASGRLSGLQCPLITDRGHHAQREVPPVLLVVLDPGADPGPCRSPGREVLDRAELELQGGVPGLDDRVVNRQDPGRPIDWEMQSRWQARRTRPAVYSPPWSVCMMTPGTWPPAIASNACAGYCTVTWSQDLSPTTDTKMAPTAIIPTAITASISRKCRQKDGRCR